MQFLDAPCIRLKTDPPLQCEDGQNDLCAKKRDQRSSDSKQYSMAYQRRRNVVNRRKDMQERYDALNHLPERVQGVFGECATYTSCGCEVALCSSTADQGILGFLDRVHRFEFLEDHAKKLVAG